MGRLQKCGLLILSVLLTWISIGMIAGQTCASAADGGMKILSENPQVYNAETAGEEVRRDLPPRDDAGVMSGKEPHGRKVQVDIGEGFKAFFSVASSPLDFDGHHIQHNYGATVGLNIPF